MTARSPEAAPSAGLAEKDFRLSIPVILGALVLVKLLLHAATAGAFGYFRDELYYLTCADHPALGYVDHPALSIWLLDGWRWLFGESLFSIRLLAALVGSGTIVFCGLSARELGGGRFAVFIAGAAALLAPVFLSVHSFYSMNALDHLLWTAAVFVLLRAMRAETVKQQYRRWLTFGLLLGLGLLNKYSIGLLILGLVVGCLLTERRALFKERWPWLAAGTALLVFLPHLLWQLAQGFPTLEFIHNATFYKNTPPGVFTLPAESLLHLTPIGFLLLVAACVHGSLTPAQRADCGIFCTNYGLPPAISPHNSYRHWGPPPTHRTWIVVGATAAELKELFAHVELKTTFSHPWVMDYEDDKPIRLCSEPLVDLAELWPELRFYI